MNSPSDPERATMTSFEDWFLTEPRAQSSIGQLFITGTGVLITSGRTSGSWIGEENAVSWISVQQQIEDLQSRVSMLEQGRVLHIPVTTFAPAPYEVVQPFEIVVEPSGEEYVASFYDANVNASGETPTEAYANAKDMILGTFELLSEMDEGELGPEPHRQLAVLGQFVRNQ